MSTPRNPPRSTVAAPPPAPTDDRLLMTALSEGDLSALGELYDLHAHAVRRFLRRATGSVDVADDLTQDTFLGLADAAKRYDGAHSVRSFVIGIAGKLVLRRRRSAAIALRILSELARWVGHIEERTPEAAAATGEDLERYRFALTEMSEAKRVVVLMADVEGLTGPEIAEALSLPLGTVWTRLHHARAALREAVLSNPAPRTAKESR